MTEISDPANLSAFASGFLLGASLIIAIGAQNAYVLRLGLLREHVFVVATICAVSDMILIVLGVAGVGTLVSSSPVLLTVAAVGGAIFLFLYGLISFYRALKPEVLKAAEDGAGLALWTVIATSLLFTWANPHVYLDTIVLLGSISGRYPTESRVFFAVGASLASVVWFYGLGYGARLLAPLFRKPIAWRVLDVLIGIVMWGIAARLVADVI